MAAAAIPLLAKVLPWALGGMSFLKGFMGGGDQKTYQDTTSKTHGTNYLLNQGTQANYNRSTPNLDPRASQLYDQLIQSQTDRLNTPIADPRSYAQSIATENIRGLNRQAELQNKVIGNAFRQRGLGYSPAAGAGMANVEAGRVGQAFTYLNQIPGIERQTQLENEGLMNNRYQLMQQLAGQMPVGQENEGFTNTSNVSEGETQGESQNFSEGNIPGSQWGSGIGSLADMLGFGFGSGMFGGGGKGGQSVGTPSGINPNYQLPQTNLYNPYAPQYNNYPQFRNPQYQNSQMQLFNQVYGGGQRY